MNRADPTINQARYARYPQEGLQPRIRELDGLRAVAIVLVFLCHVSERTFPGGWIGVDLFFVLSGYLITVGMLSEWDRYGRVSLRNFYLRRVLRLVPAFVTLVLFVIGLSVIFDIQPLEYVFWSVVYSVLYVANYAMAFGMWQWSWRGFGHVWSLAVEEQFYLLWPLCVMFFHPLLGRKVLLLLAWLVLIVFIWRIFLVLHGASVPRTFFAFDTRADTLLVGCSLAYMTYHSKWMERLRFTARWLVLPILLGFVFLTLYVDWSIRAVHLVGFTVVALLSALLIIAATVPERTVTKRILGLARSSPQ